ncbi:MAG: DUF4838 domain-containing protein [Oscillospiraceae bacterium]|nr:DUF4838 domain-containing protein [Oscillospiraceae bacterium]MDD4545683.1 DUF4838 domain-containing protein [Oscillospiraceae bacterium]
MVGNRNPVYSDMVIVQDGHPYATIVVAQNPSSKVLKAAEDLQDMIKRISGATLPISDDRLTGVGNRILVGESRETIDMGFLQPHGYPDNERVILWRDGEKLVLMGNDDEVFTGTQFAVTMLLERLGCGWYGIDELWQVIPKKDNLCVGYLHIDHTPAFSSRRNWVLRTNRELSLRWYLGGSEKEIEHAYWRLFPREIYFEQHPQWYCLIDGVRNPFIEWWQMCYSNPEVVQQTIEKIDRFIIDNPTYTQATLSANDGFFEGFCECEECRKMGTPGETMVRFVNQVAEGLEKSHPDKHLMIFIYFPTYDPPRTKMPLHKNVMLMFCKESCMFHSVDTGPDCGYHIRYQYEFGHTFYELPWLENAKKWMDMTDCKNVSIWEWYCPAAALPVWKDIPWVQGDVATRNQRCFKELGAQYIYYDQGPVDAYNDTQSSYPLRWPLWYVVAKGMWDMHITASEIIMEACKKLFEEAADLMFSYYSCLADINESCDAKAIAWHMPEPYEFYTPEAISRVDRIVNLGESILPQVSKTVRLRMENQFSLWRKANEVIQETKPGDK